jgi:hypothetical protein
MNAGSVSYGWSRVPRSQMQKLKRRDFERALRRREGRRYFSSSKSMLAFPALNSQIAQNSSSLSNKGLRNWKIILRLLGNWSGASTVSLISHACLLSGRLVRDPQGEMLLTSARDFEIFRRGLASIRDFLVLDDLTLIQTGQTGLFDGRDVNEHVFPAALRLDEPETLLRIEPLHRAARH